MNGTESFIGARFGRLVVKELLPATTYPGKDAVCACDCGAERTTKLYALKRGSVKSCGCLAKEVASELLRANRYATTHGATRDRVQTPEYMIWGGMIQRCKNPKHDSYHRYGGRGVTVCDRWAKFPAFLEDMGNRPSKFFTMERLDNELGYAPGNCVWATRSDQSRNTARSVVMTYNGQSMVQEDWAQRLGLSSATLIHRRQSGWTVEEILSTQKGGKR